MNSIIGIDIFDITTDDGILYSVIKFKKIKILQNRMSKNAIRY
ncbi:hypothetical protein [Clostridium lentum]|nr:hypothetical protein [Clostridium lentum]